MYLKFFELKKEPFQVTPDPSFLYLSSGHKEALASIVYGVEKKKGFILIVGAVGVGKTTILRAYLEKVDKDKLRVIYLFNANVSYLSLLKYIFRELNAIPQSIDISDMVTELHQILINEYKEGRNVLLLIDEAQNMPLDTLENLRMLSNLETANEKLIQIVFSGQLEFEKTLNLDELKQLKQRIAVKAEILPLTHQEGLIYIRHRLKRASESDAVIFSSCALREIVKTSGGIPRIINVLCDNSLITAFGYGKKKVTLRIVREITQDFGMQRNFRWKWVAAIIALVGICFFILGFPTVSKIIKNDFPRLDDNRVVDKPPTTIKARDGGVTKMAQAANSASQKPLYTQRKIMRGDTMAKLILDVYGRVDSRLILLVKKANPNIIDENVIVEGGNIVFPLPKGK